MPKHASTCLCEGCERDGTGEFADREASAFARAIGCKDAVLQSRLFLELSGQREQLARRREGTRDLIQTGRALARTQARR